MNGPAGALWVAAIGLTVAAIALTRFGLRQRSYRGWRFWVAAIWLGVATLALCALAATLGEPVMPHSALLAPWPLLTLIGLRRFHARRGLPGNERIDWMVLAGCAAVALLADLAARTLAAAMVSGLAVLAAHLHAAAVMWSHRSGPQLTNVRLLGTVIALTPILPALPVILSGGAMPTMAARTLAAAFGLTVMAFLALMTMGERTERELRDSRRRLRVLANIDGLTGVPNRRRFNELVQRSLRHVESGNALLLIFDLDHFKMINDKLGHAAGDRALQLVGRCMNEALRAQDVAGRLGGDEFVLLLRGATLTQAVGVASRIVTQLQLQSHQNRLPHLSLSFGIAQLNVDEPLEEALARADAALYEAKRQGRSRAVAVEEADAHPVFSESHRLGLMLN